MSDCACGDPQRADYYLNGVIGRGKVEQPGFTGGFFEGGSHSSTGTETEELSQFSCAEHATREIVNATLAERDKKDPEGFTHYGKWKILEFRKHQLRKGNQQ